MDQQAGSPGDRQNVENRPTELGQIRGRHPCNPNNGARPSLPVMG